LVAGRRGLAPGTLDWFGGAPPRGAGRRRRARLGQRGSRRRSSVRGSQRPAGVTVLISGGSGLVGTHLLDALRARGERVRALVRRDSQAIVASLGAEPVIGDVPDPGAWERAAAGGEVTAIGHAAAIIVARVSLDEFMRVNVGGTRLAVETARRLRVPLVHVSTVAVYGRSVEPPAGGGGCGEDFPFQPLSEHDYYARSQPAAEEIVREAAEPDGLAGIALRPNGVHRGRDNLFTAPVISP